MSVTCVIAVLMLYNVETFAADNCDSSLFQVADQLVKTISPVDDTLGELITLHGSQYRYNLHNSTTYLQYMFDRSFDHGGSRYLWSRYSGPHFHLASLGCAFYGGQLVEVNDEAELTAVRSFAKSNARLNCVFIGMEKSPDGVWYYTHSKSQAYTKFGPNALDSGADSICASLWSGVDWFMDDMPCSNHCHVLCEVKI